MPERPEASERCRVLLFDSDLRVMRPVLAGIAEAGMDGRFTPMGPGASAAVSTVNPHLIILSLLHPPDATFKALEGLAKLSAAPVIITLPPHTDPMVQRALDRVATTVQFDRESGDATELLRTIGAELNSAYGAETILASEGAPVDLENLPRGWGACEGCGYRGPRDKFVSHDRRSTHSLCCPGCKHHDRIVFSMR